ncbi:uncharacterized protein LOC136074966 [Hydra vulgaris]|uniref:Uncharacterized protein LOC136074966 n=1 Tax=Hydra vulgaris TaxID=6087 RepID=A0ABM4B326_HYDVU
MKRTLFFVSLFLSQADARVLDQVFYWPIKPFIFMNNNTIDGILPVFYQRLANICSPNKNLAEFYLVNETFNRNSFYKSIEKASLGTQNPPIINNAVWFPLFVIPNNVYFSTYNVKAELLMYSPNVGVIANKEKITITNKVIESMKKSSTIVLHVVGLILIFATLVWLAECKKNNDFNNLFIKGLGTGLWWAVVTVATVGYGDIVPKSLIGRVLSIFWMIIGIIFLSGMTGTFSSVMTTNSFLSIQNQQIAALNDSFDFHIAKNNFNIVSKRVYYSYDDVLQDVNSNKVEYGVVNIDALLNMDYKTKYENVALVQLLDAVSPVSITFGNQTNMMASLYHLDTYQNDAVLDCLQKLNFKDILKNVIEMYKKIPIIDTDSTQNFNDIVKINYIKYTLVAISLSFFIFAIQDVIPFVYNKCKGQQQNKIIDKNLPMSFIFNKHLNEKVKSSSKNDVHEELTLIKEQLMKLNNIILSKECCPCSKQP